MMLAASARFTSRTVVIPRSARYAYDSAKTGPSSKPTAVAGSAHHHAAHATVERHAQTHRTGLAAGDQLVGRQSGGPQGERSHALLGEHDRHHLGMQDTVLQPGHAVDAGRDDAAGSDLE